MPTVAVDLATAPAADETVISFRFNNNNVANMLNPSVAQEVIGGQLRSYLTFAMGELLQKPEIKELMIPKIKEYMESMTLSEILAETNNTLSDIDWMWREDG